MKLRLYPRSFARLLSIGFALVALPLILGLIANAVAIRQLSAQSQQAVQQATEATQASRAMIEALRGLERAARQYLVLQDNTLWERYQGLHSHFSETTAKLQGLLLTEAQRRELQQISASEAEINGLLTQRRHDPKRLAAELPRRFTALSDSARELLRQNNEAIDQEIRALQKTAADTESMMVGQLLAVLPVAAFLVLGFSHLLTRPVAELEAAIRELWSGRFERKIQVEGPSDLQSLGEQLDRLRLRLVHLEQQKSRFLRQISHELKTPLTALREGSDLLAEEVAGPLTPRQREIVTILSENSLHLRRLIEDLLDYSAADFEQSSLHLQSFRLDELVAAVVDKHRLTWSARELQIQQQVESLVLKADRERIRTVLDNLLSNAIKFSPRQGIILIAAHREENEAVIEVKDAGPGIAAEDRERVFDPFYQGRIAAGSAVKGSGLGLSIVQEHVLSHGGRIALLPATPGAHFQVRLPLEAHV
ncbi:MAG TPA: ATP-binding protein [Rhodocyclaceae bacterium]